MRILLLTYVEEINFLEQLFFVKFEFSHGGRSIQLNRLNARFGTVLTQTYPSWLSDLLLVAQPLVLVLLYLFLEVRGFSVSSLLFINMILCE